MKIVKINPAKKTNNHQSKYYIKYEKLLLEIEKKQQYRANLHNGLQKASVKISTELGDLIANSQKLSKDLVIRLDALSREIGVGKLSKEYFESYMADELDELLEIFGHQDKELSNLYKKYTGLSVKDIVNDERTQEILGSISEMYGFKMDVEEFLQKGQNEYFKDHKDEIFEYINNSADFSTLDNEGEENQPKNNKKPDATKQLLKDARNIYMRLMKKFHPDLEKDHDIITQKNEIIKQVTQAYQENDFYTLLKLQITHLDDEPDANKLADDLLKRYNKLLESHLYELDNWVNSVHVENGTILSDFIDKNGNFSPQKFAARRREIEKDINYLNKTLLDSNKRPKTWFKEQVSFMKQSMQQHMMEEMFNHLFDDIDY